MFVHLRLHTEFSVVDSTCRIDDVIQYAVKDGQVAIAITDASNIFGGLKFYNKARSKGIKPVIGVEIFLENSEKESKTTSKVLLLVQNQTGYVNLNKLLTMGWLTHVVKEQAVIKIEWLKTFNEGLIMLSGAQQSELGQNLLTNEMGRARDWTLMMAAIFPHRFYIELQRGGRPDDEAYIAQAVPFATEMLLPVVATHPIEFLQEEDFEAHEARVCIANGEILADSKRVRRFTSEQFLKSGRQMEVLFLDLPSAIKNTEEIAKRCNLSLILGQPQLPNFPVPEVDGKQLSTEAYFRYVSHKGLKERLQQCYPDEKQRLLQQERYEKRLDFEIETILNMKFPGYFLIVGDFINWARNHGCPVGPGRGSGAGSLVAYALKITALDPIQYNLLFERFLNPERVSMPDFDIDFCQSNRNLVIDYVKSKYGKDAVSQIVTFGTMAARGVVRDVGRVLDMSYGFCDGLSKLIPNKPGISVTLQLPPADRKEDDKLIYATVDESLLAEREAAEEDVKTLLELARKLEGLTRNVGMHAGGVLIAPGKLTDFCPLYQQPGSDAAVSQFDKDDVEAIGLVKFDFLGLATLTILEETVKLIRERHPGQENFTLEKIRLNDPAVFQLFSEGRTEAIFQFESSGMQKMLRDAKPTRQEDIIALNALYRPGPMDLIPSFIARKHGREKIEYPHSLVSDILSETYGIMIYQEQVMQTAQLLGGYSLGGADMLRRSMGKKKPEEMAKHRSIFREGALKNNISQEKADEVFDLMEKFAGYGFNKSHAAAYALLAYQTAWLKVHYTAEFFCANMTVEMDNTDKLKMLFDDALSFGMEFSPPDVNRGHYKFTPISSKEINYGLGAIKGTGEQAINALIEARSDLNAGNEKGPFTSFFNFVKRMDRNRVNKKTVEALIKVGAFDSLHLNRVELLESVPLAFEFAQSLQDNANQIGLFDFDDGHGSSQKEPVLIQITPWDIRENLMQEKSALGFYFSGHLFDESEQEVRKFVKMRITDASVSQDAVLLAGIVSDFRVLNGFRGKVAMFRMDDKSGMIEVRADESLFKNWPLAMAKEDALIVVRGLVKTDRFNGGIQLNAQQIWTLGLARCSFGEYLFIDLDKKTSLDLASCLTNYPAKIEITDKGKISHGLRVRVAIKRNSQSEENFVQSVSCELQLGTDFMIYPSDEALGFCTALAYPNPVQVVFNAGR